MAGRRRRGVKDYEDEMRVFQMDGSDIEDGAPTKKRHAKSIATNGDLERPRKMREATG
jgi:hypothetical protein